MEKNYFAHFKNCLLDHLLFVLYLLLAAWLVVRIPFFKHTGLSAAQLISLFLIKVAAAIFYGWIGVWYGQTAKMLDTWVYYYESLRETTMLKTNPRLFFSTTSFAPTENGYGGFFSSRESFWNNLQTNLMIKLMAVMNVFSGGNYYINALIYAFITFFGVVAFYRTMLHLFPQRKTEVLIGSFFIPSCLYWGSGQHKEGLIFLGMMMVLYPLVFKIKKGTFNGLAVLSVTLGVTAMVLLRNYLLVLLVTALMAWFLARRLPIRPIYTFLLVYSFSAVLFFSIRYVIPALNLPQLVVEKQQDFNALEGSSAVPLQTLQPTVKSFVQVAPQAMANTLLRPYWQDVKHLLSLAATTENLFFIFLFVLFLFYPKRLIRDNTLILFCLFFSLSVLLTIGYTVSFLGAVVRYRSVVIPLLLTPLLAQTEWQKIQSLLNALIKK